MSERWISAEQFAVLQGRARNGRILPDETNVIRLRVKAPENWTAFSTACAELEAEAEHGLETRLELADESGAPLLTLFYRVLPNCRVQVPFPLDGRTLAGGSAFLPPQPGVFKGGLRECAEPERVFCFDVVVVPRAGKLDSVVFAGLRLTDGWQPRDVEGLPLVDELGQRKKGTWAGKTRDIEALSDYLRGEREWAKTHNAYPPDWSRWGGWLKKKFEATGWFRREYDGRRWWLVDPDGYAFFSNGMCYGTRTGVYAMADHLENLYEWLPPKDGLYSRCWCTGDAIPQYVVRNGLEAAKKRTLVNMPRANMMRVFGEEWLDAWIEINSARMRTWGVNTLGVGVNDYRDEPTRKFLAMAGIPFVITFKFFALTKRCIFRDFPDVFSPEYEQAAREMARRELVPWRDDRAMLGYFITNEPEWLTGDNLAVKLLQQAGFPASRQALIGFLKQKYADVGALNAAWGSGFASFDELMEPAGHIPDGARADLDAFHQIMVDRYGAVVSRALREADPNHLCLGMRYWRADERTLSGAERYFDVFSFNKYGEEPVTSAAVISRHVDLPIVVGEWHIGAMDSGLDAWGICYADTQAERAQAMSYYMEQTTQDPHLVGIHYFEYSDQPFLGRFDGECYNIGLIDVCNRPYPLVTEAYSAFARHMYPMLDGQIKPEAAPVPLKRNR